MRGLVIIAAVVLTLLVVMPVLMAGMLDKVYSWLYGWLKDNKPDWWNEDWWITAILPENLNITGLVWGWIDELVNTLGNKILWLGSYIGQIVSDALEAISLPAPEDPTPLGIGVLVLGLAGLAYVLYRLVRG